MTAFTLEETTIAALQAAMADGQITSEQLVLLCLERIARYDQAGITLNSVLEVNPDALFIAQAMDRERELTGPRGPMHGIPVLLKDNIDTADKMHTSAGSLALAANVAPRDAFIVGQLRKAGAVILGKTNMTEFANYMTEGMPSGYSSRGGQVLNPYLPGKMSPSGSSSGSGAAVAANLAVVAVGTETSGSILSPSSNQSIVGIKPTVGLVSRTGIIPIANSQDTAGPMARTVADAAVLLGALTGIDPADPATAVSAGRAHTDYTQFLDPDGLKGARIGVPRPEWQAKNLTAGELELFERAVRTLRELGAEVIDPVAIPNYDWWGGSVLEHEFKVGINAYLASLGPTAPVRSLEEIIAFNNSHPEATLKYGQTLLTSSAATSGTLTEPRYLQDRLKDLRQSRTEGINAVMAEHQLDALLLPGGWGVWLPAKAGYPSITVPGGYYGEEGRPMGLTFTGRAWSEPALIRLGYAYEQATKHRVPPKLS